MSQEFEEILEEPRKLARIERIVALQPIPEKDLIELATIQGYKVVVKKGDFAVGDLCAFFEVGSYLDVSRPEFAFLQKRAKEAPDGKRRARIQEMKLGQAWSEGLAIALKDLPELKAKIREGEEITAQLDVIKYEPSNRRPPRKQTLRRRIVRKILSMLPGPLRMWVVNLLFAGEARELFATWPRFAPKQTDEPKLKSNTWFIKRMAGLECYTSLKLDGSSFTAVKRRGKLTVCSRTTERTGTDDAFVKMAAKYKLQDLLPEGYSIQGEMLATNIQDNRLGVTEPELHVFNVFRDGKQLPLDEALQFCAWITVPHVPVLERFVVDENLDLDALTARVAKMKYEKTGFPAEGIVIRACDLEVGREKTGLRLSCKLINPAYEIAVGKKKAAQEAKEETEARAVLGVKG